MKQGQQSCTSLHQVSPSIKSTGLPDRMGLFNMYEGGERDVNERSSSAIFLLKHVSCFPSSVNTKEDLKHATFQTSCAFYLYSLQMTLKLLQIIQVIDKPQGHLPCSLAYFRLAHHHHSN